MSNSKNRRGSVVAPPVLAACCLAVIGGLAMTPGRPAVAASETSVVTQLLAQDSEDRRQLMQRRLQQRMEGQGPNGPGGGDMVARFANRVAEKFQNMNCAELRDRRAQRGNNDDGGPGGGPGGGKEKMMNFLKNHPDKRREFINIIAPVVANKMFDCDLIP